MNHFDDVTVSAFADELEKIGGVMSFLSKGFKNLGTLGRRSWGEHKNLATKIYQRGAKKGGVWGGITGLAKSPYGSAAGAAGLTGMAASGMYNAMPRFGQQQQQRY